MLMPAVTVIYQFFLVDWLVQIPLEVGEMMPCKEYFIHYAAYTSTPRISPNCTGILQSLSKISMPENPHTYTKIEQLVLWWFEHLHVG